jgi:hypothetical protein
MIKGVIERYLNRSWHERLTTLIKHHFLESRPGSHAWLEGGTGAASAEEDMVYLIVEIDEL